MVTGFQFLVITIFFYLVTSVMKIGFECVHQISNRRKSWLCCIKFNGLLVYCQSTKNSPSHLWVQLCCNRVCDYFLPKQDKVKLIHVQPLNKVWNHSFVTNNLFQTFKGVTEVVLFLGHLIPANMLILSLPIIIKKGIKTIRRNVKTMWKYKALSCNGM